MSCSSDSEEFFDAEDDPHLKSRKTKLSNGLTPSLSDTDFQNTLRKEDKQKVLTAPFRVPSTSSLAATNNEPVILERLQASRSRLKELRHRMQTEDEDPLTIAGNSPTGSQTSSLDGVFTDLETRSSHPFRIIEHDALSLHSLTSLGRVARVVGSTQEMGGSVGGEAEPDVIASTKSPPPPVPPPRTKRKNRLKPPPDSLPLEPPPPPHPAPKREGVGWGSVPSPGTTIDHLTRELQHSLDISSALKGRYVVKPQELNPVLQDGVEVGRGGGGGGHSSTYPLGGGGVVERERRRSAGDERGLMGGATHPRLSALRTRTDSGKPLSDLEILEQVTVLNLDTGERVPLSIAEDKLPQCINPLSLHIMRLTSEYVSNTSLEKDRESDADSVDSKQSCVTTSSATTTALRHTTSQLIKRFLGTTVRRTMIKAKTIGQRQKGEDGLEVEGAPHPLAGPHPATDQQFIKLKASNSHKGPYDFDCLQHVQELSGEHTGPVWCMKFSSCGRLLATAGQDRVLRIWVLNSAYPYFQEIRTKYNCEKVSPTPSEESLVSQVSMREVVGPGVEGAETAQGELFLPRPFCTYWGHTSDLLDISWSKNYFILSSSMDKTVRLWHISRKECLCCFQHIEFVTAIVFHPRDDRYFLSGSLDGKLRLWNIPDKKVAVWNELDGPTKLITAANFCQNGKFAVVGSYDGRCIFFTTDQLKYHTTIHVRSSRGKNRTGRKISGIEPMPGEDKILVTSNDSRIRLYDLRDLSLSCKYKGYVNMSSQIRASFSHDGKYIVSGSENQCIYIWKSNHDYGKFSSARRDRNDYWEGVKAHSAVVTCAVFSPQPLGKQEEGAAGYLLVSADFAGSVKVFVNRTRPRHSSLPASALA